MDRRQFFHRMTAATAAGAATGLDLACTAAPRAAHAVQPAWTETSVVTYQVKGFTCVTCAVGLEAMLRGLDGVTRASASYPANHVAIGFDEQVTSEKALKEFIADCGFSVA